MKITDVQNSKIYNIKKQKLPISRMSGIAIFSRRNFTFSKVLYPTRLLYDVVHTGCNFTSMASDESAQAAGSGPGAHGCDDCPPLLTSVAPQSVAKARAAPASMQLVLS